MHMLDDAVLLYVLIVTPPLLGEWWKVIQNHTPGFGLCCFVWCKK